MDSRIRELEGNVASMPAGTASVNFCNPPAGLRFGGEERERPWAFIRAVENYFLMARIPENMKTKMI